MRAQDRYVPAFLFSLLAPVYDPLIRWTMRERAFKGRLVEEARIAPGHRVLDLGCGTGTLLLLVKAREPRAEVVGIDGDPSIAAYAVPFGTVALYGARKPAAPRAGAVSPSNNEVLTGG